ncbi:hypothetical protein QQM79_01160 [Marinobacteraceae bacterium S3BR75-40.1]
MNSSAPFQKLAVLVLSLTLLLLGPIRTAAAAEMNPLLDALHRFRLENFLALNAYYNYSANRDQQTMKQIVESMNGAHSLLKSFTEKVGDSLTADQLKELTSMFQDFAKLMNTNIQDVRKRGYPDLRLVSEMANQARLLSDKSREVYITLTEKESIPTDPTLEKARKASLTMALMLTKYSARSNSSSSQTFQGADTETPLDQLAGEFDGLMKELLQEVGNADAEKSLRDAKSKWNFIQKSYVNYNENNVYFLINRYSLGIIEQLENASEQMQTS